MSVTLDLSITPSAMIYRLLTESTNELPSGTTLTENDITLSNVQGVSGRDDGANTVITLTPVVSSNVVYGSAVDRYYTRKSLTDAAVQAGFSLAITDDLSNWSTDTAAASALSQIQTFYSAITASDLQVASPVTNADGSVSVLVTMASDHLTLNASATFVITAPENRTPSSDIPGTLPGLS